MEIVTLLILLGSALFACLVFCIPFVLLWVVCRRIFTPKNDSLKDEIIKAQREYELFWKPNRKD